MSDERQPCPGDDCDAVWTAERVEGLRTSGTGRCPSCDVLLGVCPACNAVVAVTPILADARRCPHCERSRSDLFAIAAKRVEREAINA